MHFYALLLQNGIFGCRQAENNKHLETLRNKHPGHCCCLLSVYQLEAMVTVFLTRLMCLLFSHVIRPFKSKIRHLSCSIFLNNLCTLKSDTHDQYKRMFGVVFVKYTILNPLICIITHATDIANNQNAHTSRIQVFTIAGGGGLRHGFSNHRTDAMARVSTLGAHVCACRP